MKNLFLFIILVAGIGGGYYYFASEKPTSKQIRKKSHRNVSTRKQNSTSRVTIQKISSQSKPGGPPRVVERFTIDVGSSKKGAKPLTYEEKMQIILKNNLKNLHSSWKKVIRVAKRNRRPIAIILSTEMTRCPLALECNRKYKEFFKTFCVTVFHTCGNERKFDRMPMIAQMSTGDGGKMVPKVIIFSPDMTEKFLAVPYISSKNRYNILKNYRSKIRKALKRHYKQNQT